MIKNIFLTLLTFSSLAFANELILKSQNSMVKVANPKLTKSVYLGSFLAKGHLPADQIYRIDAPVEGVVKMLNVSIYEEVTKHTLLAVIKSPEMLELESTYINLIIEKEYNENEIARLEPLYKAAVVPKKQYLKAKNTLAKYQTQTEFYYHLLQEWGLSKKQVERIKRTKKPIPEIKLYSPIAGKISDLNIFPKMYLQRGEHLMTVLNDHSAHIEVALPINVAKRLKPGLKLYIEDMPVIVESIAAQTDARTQTLAVHLMPKKEMYILANEKKSIKLFWPQVAFEVPSSAVIEYDNKPALFIKNGSTFQLIFLNVLSRSSEKVYVKSSKLTQNTKIAISGVISLKGALEGQQND